MPRPARKRQQRLAFTPIPSSSPAAKGYHKQIRDRAAAVTLAESPKSSSRRPHETGPDDAMNLISEDEVPIPTPAASLELGSKARRRKAQESSSESEPIRSTQRSGSIRAKRPRQQRLDFSNACEPSSFDSPVQLSSSTHTRTSKKPSMFSSQSQGCMEYPQDDSFSDGSQDLPSPRKMLKARKEEKKSSRNAVVKADEESDTLTPQTMAVGDDDDDDIVAAGSRKEDRREERNEEDTGDDTDMPTTQRKRRQSSRQATKAISGSPIRVVDEEEDDTDIPTTQGRQPRKRKLVRRNSFISDSPPPTVDSDDDVTVLGSRKRARDESVSEARSEDNDEEEEDALPKTPGRRGLKRRTRQLSQREKEDLDEDLDFLGPSSDDDTPPSGRRPRNTQSAQKNAKQQALERLKRARAGQGDQVEELLEENDDEEQGDEDAEDRAEDYTSSHRFFRENEEDADFVEEEDEESPLGVPAGIPLEFTRYASLKPKELFKYAVDWMVQKYINPAFQKQDALYDLTFRKLNDEAQGLAGSKFKSSVWTSAFRYALEARPQIEIHELDGIEMEDHDKCDACNRSSHQCTFKIRFHGKPYHNDTLEEIASDDEDSDSDREEESQASDQAEYNADGLEIVGTDHFFFVGRFCKGNATTGHALQHWRFHLNEYVHEYLKGRGYFVADELEKRQGWSIKKLGKYANKILEGMDRDGEVKNLWKMFRANLDEARTSKGGGRFRGSSP